MRRWRPGLRIARRDALRHKARSLTVLMMIGLPVAGVTAADVVLRTQDVSAREGLERDLGRADAVVSLDDGVGRLAQSPDGQGVSGVGRRGGRRPTIEQAHAVLGSDARVIRYDTGQARIRTRLGAILAEAAETDFSDPMTRGLYGLVRGRLPQRPGEVVVSRRLADRGFSVGNPLPILGQPRRTVVGVVEAPDFYRQELVAGLPGEIGLQRGGDLHQLLVAKPGGVTWDDVRALNRFGMSVRSRQVIEHPPPDSEVDPRVKETAAENSSQIVGFGVLVAVMALLEVALLAGPAFAVGARARQRTLALMASAGAGPRDLRRSVLALAMVLGGAGAALGVAVGVGASALAVPLAQDHTDTRFGPFDVVPTDLLGIALFGLLSAVLAAAVPAWIASRQDPVAVLTGRRGEPAPSRASPLLGLVLLGIGVVGSAKGARSSDGGWVIAIATIFSVIGTVLIVPTALALLGRVAHRLPLALRFVLRDAARHRSRSTLAVAAVAATVIGVTALGIASASDSRERERLDGSFAPAGAGVVSAPRGLPAGAPDGVRRAVPGATVRTVDGLPNTPSLRFSGVRGTSYSAAYGSSVIVAEGDVGGLQLGLSDEQVRRADATLAAGGAVVLGRARAGAHRTTIRRRRRPPVTAPAVFTQPDQPSPNAQAIIAPAVARELRERAQPRGLLVTGVRITQAQANDIREVMTAIAPTASVYTGGDTDDYGGIARLVLAVIGAILMLGGTLTATYLALADARADLATLSAVGAAPRTRRAVAAAYAGVISMVGAILGAVIGFVPGVAAAWSNTDTSAYSSTARDLPGHFVAVPWLTIGAIVILLPLFAAVVVGVTSRSRLPMVSRQA